MLLALGLLLGCGYELELQDDLGPSPELHQPWLPGSAPVLTGTPNRRRSEDRLTVEVADPSVAEVRSVTFEGKELQIALQTLAPGKTELMIRAEGSDRLLHQEPIEVRNPDDVSLIPAPDVFQEKSPRVREPTIVVGGTASFLAQLTADDTVVYGNVSSNDDSSTDDLGEVQAREGMAASLTDALAGVEGRWVVLETDVQGDHPITLEPVDGVELDVVVHAVMPAAIAELRWAKADEENAEPEQSLQLAVRAFDAYDEELYGAPLEWEIDGKITEVRGGAQVLHYEYLPSKTKTAIVRLNDLEIETEFHGRVIDSDYACGCTSAGWSSSWPMLLVLGAVRRRRHTAARALTRR